MTLVGDSYIKIHINMRKKEDQYSKVCLGM